MKLHLKFIENINVLKDFLQIWKTMKEINEEKFETFEIESRKL
jgi:hypothetical protein